MRHQERETSQPPSGRTDFLKKAIQGTATDEMQITEALPSPRLAEQTVVSGNQLSVRKTLRERLAEKRLARTLSQEEVVVFPTSPLSNPPVTRPIEKVTPDKKPERKKRPKMEEGERRMSRLETRNPQAAEAQKNGLVRAFSVLKGSEIEQMVYHDYFSRKIKKVGGIYYLDPQDARIFTYYLKSKRDEREQEKTKNQQNEVISFFEEQGFTHYTSVLSRKEQQQLRDGHRYKKFYIKVQGKIFMTAADVLAFRELKEVPLHNGRKDSNRKITIPLRLQRQGYTLASLILTENEYDALKRSQRYKGLFKRIDTVILMRPVDIQTFRNMRMNREYINFTISEERRKEGYQLASDLLTPQEARALRRSNRYKHLIIIERGRMLVRPMDAEVFKLAKGITSSK